MKQLKVANIADSSVGKCHSIKSSNIDFKHAFSPLKISCSLFNICQQN